MQGQRGGQVALGVAHQESGSAHPAPLWGGSVTLGAGSGTTALLSRLLSCPGLVCGSRTESPVGSVLPRSGILIRAPQSHSLRIARTAPGPTGTPHPGVPRGREPAPWRPDDPGAWRSDLREAPGRVPLPHQLHRGEHVGHARGHDGHAAPGSCTLMHQRDHRAVCVHDRCRRPGVGQSPDPPVPAPPQVQTAAASARRWRDRWGQRPSPARSRRGVR